MGIRNSDLNFPSFKEGFKTLEQTNTIYINFKRALTLENKQLLTQQLTLEQNPSRLKNLNIFNFFKKKPYLLS